MAVCAMGMANKIINASGVYLIYEPGKDILTNTGLIINQAIIGIMISLMFFSVVLFGGLHWFKSWEGRKEYE